jgi:predicted RNA methylase
MAGPAWSPRSLTPDEAKALSSMLSDLLDYLRFGMLSVFPLRVAEDRAGNRRIEVMDANKGKVYARSLKGSDRMTAVTDTDDWATVLDMTRIPSAPYKPGPVAEPWQITQEEAVKRSGYKAPKWIAREKGAHRYAVVVALRSGYPVPASVMADFPGLRLVYGPGTRDFEPPSEHVTDPDLIVAHSADTGTTITTRPEDRSWNDAIHALGMGFKWWREGKRWYRNSSRGFAEPSVPLESIASRLAAGGARVKVIPVVSVTEREAAEARREHLIERAERYESRAAVAAEKLAAMQSPVPMKAPSSAIPADVLEVLKRSQITGNELRLPGQLDRPLYAKVDKVLNALGATWNRKAKAHLLSQGATDTIRSALDAGRVTFASDLGYFPTPDSIARDLVERANIQPGMKVLEPSAGAGAIVAPLLAVGAVVTAVEFDAGRAASLASRFPGAVVRQGDFLAMRPSDLGQFDAVVMNPPFSLQGRPQADMDHVTHAISFVRPGGMVVAVMSAGVTFRENKRAEEFRTLVEQMGGWIEPLPEDAFKVSGTGVRTVIATIPVRARNTGHTTRKDEETPEERKLREQQEMVDHLESVARGRRQEAESLSVSVTDRIAAGNAFVDAVGDLITKNIKRDTGALRISGGASAGKSRRRGFTVVYLDANGQEDWRTIRVFPGEIQVGTYAGITSSIGQFNDPNEAYAAILERMPRIAMGAVAAESVGGDKMFSKLFSEYAKRRLKRDTRAGEVEHRYGGVRANEYFWMTFGSAKARGDIVYWAVTLKGSVVEIERHETREGQVVATVDVTGLGVAEAYKRVVAALNAAREKSGDLARKVTAR